jgi:hypothetical protein
MPFKDLEDGLYLVEQKSVFKGNNILHYGVLDVGNILNHPKYLHENPLILHQTPPQIRADYLSNTGIWTVRGVVTLEDLDAAIKRIQDALKNPHYDLFGHNCEHFARYVTQGKRTSHQVMAAVGTAAILGVLFWVIIRNGGTRFHA